MTVSFYASISSDISTEWTPFPHSPNYENINETPGAPDPRIVPVTIDIKNYNSDQRDSEDVYGITINPLLLPSNATDIKMYLGARMRTKRHAGRFYAYIGLYNGVDNWFTISRILDVHQWQPAHSEVIEGWHRDDILSISQIKLKADTNPIEVCTLYLYIQYVYGAFIIYGTGKIYGTGWTYGLNPV